MCSFWYFGSYDITDCKLHFRIRFFGAFADDSTHRSCAISGWMSSTVAGIECREVDWSWKGGLGHS